MKKFVKRLLKIVAATVVLLLIIAFAPITVPFMFGYMCGLTKQKKTKMKK